MKLKIAAAAAATTLALGAPAAHAGVYAADLSKCLVASTTPAEQRAFVVWVFAAMTKHPDLASFSAVTPAQQEAANKDVGQLMVRLLTVACRQETVNAVKYEGPSTMETAFATLGEAAMRNIMSDANVTKAFSGVDAYIDRDKLLEVGREAGVAPH